MTEQSEEKPKELAKPSEEEGAPKERETEGGIPEEILEKLPPEARRVVRQAISVSGMSWTGPMPNPVLSKVTSEHVTDMIRYTENENVREHSEQTATRRYSFLYFIVTAIFLVGILIYLTEVGLTDLFKTILLILGGVGAGFGLGRLRRSRE